MALKGDALEQVRVAYMLSYALDRVHEENEQLRLVQQQKENQIQALQIENERLKEQLRLLQHRHFGKKSEVGESSLTAETQPIPVAAHYRKKNKPSAGRLIDTSQLPRHVIHHDLSQEDRQCSVCRYALHLIGTDSAEQLEVLPLRLYCVEHIRYKYGCRHCQTVQMAPKPMAPIPKALAGSSLLAEILTNKYEYHLPLYRQSKMLASYQAIIPDNTLGNWVSQIGMSLMPLYDALWESILASRYLQVDETTVKVLKPERTGYLWSYFAPHIGQGAVCFEMSLTRSASVAKERLAQFKGLLQTDGYSGYQALRDTENIVGLGCLTHARRKFSDVLKISKNPQGIAAQAIERLQPLYALESKMREATLCFHTCKRLRQKIARPILNDFFKWLKQQRSQVPSNSQLGQAINYSLKQKPYIIKYLRHGIAQIDTNLVENKIRQIALGRKNFLFIGHKDSGTIHALFYSLVLTCILNNLNPRVYLHYVITKVHDLRKGTVTAMQLLPHTIDRNELQLFSNAQVQLAKQILNSN